MTRSEANSNSRSGIRNRSDTQISVQSTRSRRAEATSLAADRAAETTVRRQFSAGMSVASSQAANSLVSAATTGELALVRALVKVGVLVDAAYKGVTALMAAASNGQLEVLRFLVRHRANVDFRRADGATALYLACQGGYTDVALYLLKRYATADVITATGKTALHAAVQGGHTAIVSELLRCWASTRRKDGAGKRASEYVSADKPEITTLLAAQDKKTALLDAVRSGELDVVEYLLTRGHALDTRNLQEETALLVAAGGGSGRVEITRALLAAGADRSDALEDGSSALHIAVRAAGARGGAKMVQLLLQEGVDSRSLDTRGKRASEYADDPHVVQALERHDARHKLLYAAEAGDLNLVMHHVAHGAALDSRGRADGATPLLAAVQNAHADVAQHLLESGADPNAAATVGGLTPLHVAAAQNAFEMVECLLHHGANMQLADHSGKLPGDYATDRVLELLNKMMVETRIATGSNDHRTTKDDARPTEEEPLPESSIVDSANSSQGSRSEMQMANNESSAIHDNAIPTAGMNDSELTVAVAGEVALENEVVVGQVVEEAVGQADQSTEGLTDNIQQWCFSVPPPAYDTHTHVPPPLAGDAMSGNESLQPTPVDPNADTDRLLIAVRRNDLETMRSLLPYEGDIEARSKTNSYTSLCWAAKVGNLEMVQCLAAEGAMVNASTPSGYTPLLLAASFGHAEVVQHLLMKGADSEAFVPRNGYTALLHAADKGYADVVHHLVKRRVNVDARSTDGSTALHLAASMGRAAVVQLLLAGGADVAAVTHGNKFTALHLASSMDHSNVVWLLLGSGADPQAKDSKGLSAADVAHSNQLRRVLLASKAERTASSTEAWWGQWRSRGPVGSTGGAADPTTSPPASGRYQKNQITSPPPSALRNASFTRKNRS
ncbi:hypothetical protein BBJ28_00015925 [Nothophytophthora sp. Chile5]|nr:hypothetical protein BBJ28_00015925 [Nothophytophthora sp. Chile5]